MFVNMDREGGGVIADEGNGCAGTANDQFFWGWYDTGGTGPSYGCAGTPYLLGTGCNGNHATYRYNLMFFGGNAIGSIDYPKDCVDLEPVTSGYYTIYPDSQPGGLSVWCEIGDARWARYCLDHVRQARSRRCL
jgi:hypothetical protein